MTDIDEVAVARAYAGEQIRLTRTEQRELWRRIAHDLTRDPHLTQTQIAARLRVCYRTVQRRVAAARADGIPVPARYRPVAALADRALLEQLYVADSLSASAIAVRLRCDRSSVVRALRRHGITVRSATEQIRILRAGRMAA